MKNKIFTVITIIAGAVLFLSGCKKDLSNTALPGVADQVTILQYIEGNPPVNFAVDSLKMLLQLIKRTGRESVLNSFGSYTLLAPTDRAFTAYLGANKSISDLTDVEAQYLMNYLILCNKFNFKALNIGIVPDVDSTVSGLKVLYLPNGNDIMLNKVAKAENLFEATNGNVYTMSAVLDPPAANIYDYLVQSGRYTIMTQVFEQTGLKDTLQKVEIPNPYNTLLNRPTDVNLTTFVESDDVLKSNGINTIDALKLAVLNKSKSWTTNSDSALTAFAKYHLCPGLIFLYQLFLNDNVNQENLITFALNRSKVIHTNASFSALPVLNADSTGNGVGFNDVLSDKIVKNGVVHDITGILYIPTAAPKAVKFTRECEHGLRFYVISTGGLAVFLNNDSRISNGTLNYDQNIQYTTDELSYWGIGTAVIFQPYDIGDYIEFDLKNLPPARYQIFLNYHRDNVNASRNVVVYLYKKSDGFNIKSTPIMSGLDMANVSGTAPVDPDYGQMKPLVPVTNPYHITAYGDYTIRFVHADRFEGIYDAIIFNPVN